ncbi:MAG: head GIN domain-containing protein [Bacteroidales bacterium]
MKENMKKKTGLLAVSIATYLLVSCTSNVITGQMVKESRDLPSFEGVSLAFSGNVYITQGSPQRVEIEADKNTLEIIETRIENNVLVLKYKNGQWRDLGKVTVHITMPGISTLTIAGSGDMICKSPVKVQDLELSVSGSGSLKMDHLTFHEIDAAVSGSGSISLIGNGDPGELDARITGSGSLNAGELSVGEAVVNITGSGSATVFVVKELETNITGSGSVYYKGNPIINANAVGSGRTKPVN